MRNPNLRNAPNPKGRQKRRAAIDEVGPGEQQGHAIAEAVRAFRPSRPPGRARPETKEVDPQKVTVGKINEVFSGQTFKARAPVRVSMGYEEGES